MSVSRMQRYATDADPNKRWMAMYSMREFAEIYDMRRLMVGSAFFAVLTVITTLASRFLAEAWCPDVKDAIPIIVFALMLTFYFAVYGPWIGTRSVSPQWKAGKIQTRR